MSVSSSPTSSTTMLMVEEEEEEEEEDELAAELFNRFLLEDAAFSRPPDVATRILSLLFCSTCVLSLEVVIMSIPLFFWPLPHAGRVVILSLACNGFVGSYAAMIVLRKHSKWYYPFAALQVWIASLAGILGCAAGLADNAAPIILAAMFWAQHATAWVYVLLTGSRHLNHLRAMVLMVCATLGIWCLNIVTFVVRHDWISGSCMLVVAIFNVAYISWQLRLSSSVGRYNLSWSDWVRSIIEFYADPCIAAWAWLQNRGEQ